MLESYKSGQPVLYSILSNAIMSNRLSHAYLFDADGNSDAMDIVLSFVKEIVDMDISSNEEKKIVNKRITDGNYLDVKVIEADGMWIKKNQLVDLQEEFSRKAIEGKKKIYIIKSADKMNVQTANSILKFLEEPVDDIIAILIVDNMNLMLQTIISRCQVIKLNKKGYEDTANLNFFNMIKNGKYGSMNDQDRVYVIDNVISFIKYIEDYGIDTIIYVKKFWNSNFKDRNFSLITIELMIQFYYDVIRNKANLDIDFFKDKLDIVRYVSQKNEFCDIIKKIEILDVAKSNIKMNLNVNLLVDKLIIEMCR